MLFPRQVCNIDSMSDSHINCFVLNFTTEIRRRQVTLAMQALKLVFMSFHNHLHFYIIWLSNILDVPDECYSRNVSCALHLISNFLFKQSISFLIVKLRTTSYHNVFNKHVVYIKFREHDTFVQ